MLVLVVTKTTNYELYGARIEAKLARGRLNQESLDRLKTAHDEHYATLARLRQALKARAISHVEITREDEHPPAGKLDAVLSVGGDGTLLAASHHMVSGGRLYGIRSSVSSVGYLCCAGVDGIEKLVADLAGGGAPVVPVARLAAEITRVDSGMVEVPAPVLNDFLFTNANPAATTRYKLSFDGHSETQRSSGIWVATAAGSTAAILAAGGHEQALSDTRFQYKVRELYRLGHVKPQLDNAVFDPAVDVLELENRCPEAILALDGQHGLAKLSYGDKVRFLAAAPLWLGKPRAYDNP